MRKLRVLNLYSAAYASGHEPEVYSDRVVLRLYGNPSSSGYRQVVRVHLEWGALPWLMRKLWAAWWRHKADVLRNLSWIERELAGAGVEKPKELTTSDRERGEAVGA
jgi:hypothetical protein